MVEPAPIEIRGAGEHNLAGFDLDIPFGRWIAVTGPSGSGKTSLVFDTLVREGQRRYLGGLSARARQLFGKLGRAHATSIRGLPVPLSIGHASVGSSRSTVGTRSGALDLLRLVFARSAVDPGGEPLSRSHFSFNVAPGACEACGGLGVEDRVDPRLLVADPSKSIRDGALVPTLPNGYTVYSQVTLEVMDTICRAHGFDVHTPWRELDDDQREVVLHGSKKLTVPFGKHSIESRMKWEGITARPREEGYYRGLVPVIEETLTRNRNANILRFVESAACSACGGTRLSRPGRQATLGGLTLPDLLALRVVSLAEALASLPQGPALEAVRPSIDARIARMCALSLGHLSLDRTSDGLSGGEAQRLQLASLLGTGLGGMLVALDEPTLGLHPDAQPGMRDTLDEVLQRGNALVVVEHDPQMVRHADRVLALGPGAGLEGGRLVEVGDPRHPLGPPPEPRPRRHAARGVLELSGATLHNLRDARLEVELGCFNVVLGPSGAGKSSLVFGTLLPALEGKRGGPYRRLEGVERASVAAIDARPIGRTPRSTPATWTGLFDRVRKAFAATPEAKAAKLGAAAFSYNNKAGRCPQCEGLGVERIGLHLLEDVERRCGACGGGRYSDAVLGVRLRGKTIAEVLQLSIDEAVPYFEPDEVAYALCSAMQTLGLGYLPLGHGSHQLSRGEAQRVKLSTLLGRADAEPSLLLLDEPDRGLHPVDIERLVGAIDALVDAGHTVLAISHHRHVWAAADVRIEVLDGVATHGVPFERPPKPAPRSRARHDPPSTIELRGVTTHGLQSIDVDIPHRALVVVAGVSGSGKSSLVFDTLAAEAWHRFSESLPFSVRQHVRRQPRPQLDSAEGLTPVVTLRQGGARANRRSTVATQAEVGPLLRLLWARAGSPAGYSAEHFSPDRPVGACPACAGMGLVPRCSPTRLITEPDQRLCDGAMAGTKPGRFLSGPDDQHVATLQAALRARGLPSDLEAPWRDLSPDVHDVALFGSGDLELSVQWSYKRGKRSGTHSFEGPWLGFCALVEREAKRRANRKDAAAWMAPLEDAPCRDCDGHGLKPEIANVSLGTLRLSDVMNLRADAVIDTLDAQILRGASSDVYRALRADLASRLHALRELGLGHLRLARRSPTLSAGELQRLRLAGVLHAGLAHVTFVLDEPAAGLADSDIAALIGRLRALRNEGNTVIVVSHRPALLRAADHILELGPGGGPEGGRVIASGSPSLVLGGDTASARALRAGPKRWSKTDAPIGVRIEGASARGLPNLDVDFPERGIINIVGPSGSGKSTLLFDVIEPSARTGRPVGCAAVTGLDRFVDIRSSRGPLGRTPLSVLGALPALQRLFVDASGGALPMAAFSFDSPKGRCETCRGTGVERVAMDALADLRLPCSACDGRRYRPEVLDVRWRGRTIADVLDCPATLLRPDVGGDLRRALDALLELGLGHLSFGRSRDTLSGGEAQRLLLAGRLLDTRSPALILLDEPTAGLHEQDIRRLLDTLEHLAARGDLILLTAPRLQAETGPNVIGFDPGD